MTDALVTGAGAGVAAGTGAATATGAGSVVVAAAAGGVRVVVAAGAAGAAATPGVTAEVPARLAFEPAPPPPPQATRVVPNTAIAAIRIAKFWSGSVMAVFREVTMGNKLLPQRISEGYAKARSANRGKIAAVQNFVRIQRNIVENFTNIVRCETQLIFDYVGSFAEDEIKKPPKGRFLQDGSLISLNATKPP
jgi:hypothetical protein